jgi:CRP-like cAMP-binding protein
VETTLERELSRVLLGSAPHWLRLRTGAILVSQGDPGDELYLLSDGLLAVEIDGVTVTELGPGAVVGEVALVAGGRRTATLRAVTPCRVAAVPGDRIDRAALAELARTRGWPGPGGDAAGPTQMGWPSGPAGGDPA